MKKHIFIGKKKNFNTARQKRNNAYSLSKAYMATSKHIHVYVCERKTTLPSVLRQKSVKIFNRRDGKKFIINFDSDSAVNVRKSIMSIIVF